MTIGVAITTHNRRCLFLRTLKHWQNRLPADALLVVVDDGSDHPVPDIPGVTVLRNRRAQGIAAAKNLCLAELAPHCEHIFLSDDDCAPINPNWWKPYVDDPQPHLMHCWGRRRLIADDGHYTTWTWPRGVLLYVQRHVIDTVGGMRTEFGRWGGEHAEWSQRIHNAGLTTHPFTDLTVAAKGVWHALDYARTTPSTVSAEERRASADHRGAVAEKHAGSTDYVEYRTQTVEPLQ